MRGKLDATANGRSCHGVVTTHALQGGMWWHTTKSSSQAGDFLEMQGHPKTAPLADCKSVGLRLRRFESCTCHTPVRPPFEGA
jgi:hypothetical protein